MYCLQIAQLEQEQVALRELLDLVQQPVVDKGKHSLSAHAFDFVTGHFLFELSLLQSITDSVGIFSCRHGEGAFAEGRCVRLHSGKSCQLSWSATAQ